jgi:hypothetical protein
MPPKRKTNRRPARPITDRDREQLRELHAENLPRNEIARRMKRAPSTVSKLADELGLTFDRSRTVEATIARQTDARALRASLAIRNYQRAHAIHDRLDEPVFRWKHVTPDGTVLRLTDDHPPARDERDLASAVASYTTAADRLTDEDPGIEDARTMLTGLAAALGQAWRADPANQQQP